MMTFFFFFCLPVQSIETVKVDGSGRYSYTGLFSRRAPQSLAVFESSFYWVDNKGLWQAPQTQLSQRKFIWEPTLPVLAVYHELQQPQGKSYVILKHGRWSVFLSEDLFLNLYAI